MFVRILDFLRRILSVILGTISGAGGIAWLVGTCVLLYLTFTTGDLQFSFTFVIEIVWSLVALVAFGPIYMLALAVWPRPHERATS